uniref:Uncharacterized protein n=1 Tax=Timema genevievae TaxID=629358 RepID=A0A7R9K4D8_TIMGE|nr:unnamed protein product [Timema genevievae]
MRRHRLSGMDMTLSDYDGRTALHLAAAEGHFDCVEFLLEHCRVPHNCKDSPCTVVEPGSLGSSSSPDWYLMNPTT